MLEFAATSWLFAPAAVAVGGALALWRGQWRERPVSSSKLWRGLGGGAESSRRRRVDPLWVLVWLAGILGALALAGPRWVGGADHTNVPVEWALRGTTIGGAEHDEVWVHFKEARDAPYTLAIGGKESAIAGNSLRAGMAIPFSGAGDRVSLELRDGEGVLASDEFAAERERPFALLEIAGGQPVDAALRRAFAVQAGVVTDDPTLRPAVVLVNDAGVSPTDALLNAARLVIAEPATPLPGMTLGAVVKAGEGGWVPEVVESGFKWPAFVSLKDVRVAAIRTATFSADWRVLAKADGHAWLALREFRAGDGSARTWLWLGSKPLAETNWPLLPASFVPFFAELRQRAMGAGEGPLEWRRVAPPQNAAAAAREIDLGNFAGGVGILLLVTATVWFLGRVPLNRPEV